MGIKKTELNARMTKRQWADLLEANIMATKKLAFLRGRATLKEKS